jgi:hypothetical protein
MLNFFEVFKFLTSFKSLKYLPIRKTTLILNLLKWQEQCLSTQNAFLEKLVLTLICSVQK